MTQFSLRQLWRQGSTLVVAALFTLASSFALGENVPSSGLTLSSNPGNVTYTFVGGSSPSGPVRINLSSASTSSPLYISSAFELENDASIYTITGSGKTTTLNGSGITIASGNELTFGSSSESGDTGTINVNAAITGGQALNINRGSAAAVTALNVANSSFSGAVNITQGVLTINAVDAINANNSVVISEKGTLRMGSASTATVQTINNSGTINLNNKTLIISESGSTLGAINGGSLQFNSDFTLDDSASFDSVDIILNDVTMTVSSDAEVSSINAPSNASGTVVINDGKSLTFTEAETFDSDIFIQSEKNNSGKVIFADPSGGDFTTYSTAMFDTTSGKMVNVEVGAKNSWTLGTDESVYGLTLSGGSNSSNSADVILGNNTLTINNGIESSGIANISTTGTGSAKLATDSNFVGTGTLTIDHLDMNGKTLSVQAGDGAATSSPYTVALNKISNTGAIALNRYTVLKGDLATNAALYGYNASKIDGALTYSGTESLHIKDGTFNVTGDAKFTSGNGINMDMIEGTNSLGMPGLNVGGKLIFNTDSNSAITNDNADMTTITLSGYRSGEGLKISLNADEGIYGYGSGTGSELNNVGKKSAAIVGGTEYIVYDTQTNENYFKILLDSSAAFDVDSLTYNSGLLDITLKARTTTDNPIERVIVNGVNDGNESMTTLYNKVNATSDREAAFNQLNPYTVSATTANQMWIAQEYTSRTFQRLKMVRAAIHGYGTFDPVAGPYYADNTDSEVAYLGQDYPYPGFGFDAPYMYGPACRGFCGGQWWFRGIGAWERQEERGDLARYDADYAGFTIGVDRMYAPNLLLGLSAGGVWNTTKFHDAGGSVANGGSFLIDLYGSWFDDCNHFDFMFGYQGGSTDTTRRTDFGVDPTGGKIKSNSFIAAMELGHAFHFFHNTFEPFYDLQYINIQNDGFTEYGSEAALTVNANNHHALLQTIGIRFMRSCAGPLKGYYFLPQFEIGWVHNYSDSNVLSISSFAGATDAGTFVTTGYYTPRNRVKVAVGLDIVINPAMKFDIKYECQAASGFGFHTLTGGFDWNF